MLPSCPDKAVLKAVRADNPWRGIAQGLGRFQTVAMVFECSRHLMLTKLAALAPPASAVASLVLPTRTAPAMHNMHYEVELQSITPGCPVFSLEVIEES